MKRGWILIFCILFLIPAVSAEIEIFSLDKTTYNRGDEINLIGSIQYDSSIKGNLKTSILCGEEEVQFSSIFIKLTEGEIKSYPDDFGLGELIIPNSVEGKCNVKLALFIDRSEIDSAVSGAFTVTSELQAGVISLSKKQIQLGEEISIEGNFFEEDRESIDGLAEIYLKNNGNRYFVGSAEIKEGRLWYKYTPQKGIAPGKYTIDIEVNDIYNNRKMFKDAGSFEITNNLLAFLETSRIDMSPSSRIRVMGDVKTLLNEDVKEANVKIIVGDLINNAVVKDGKIEHPIIIPSTLPSGKNTITVEIEDSYGNGVTTALAIYVKSIPTRIGLEVGEEKVKPSSNLPLTATIYDQADKVMYSKITFEITDPEGNNFIIDEAVSSKEFSYQLQEDSLPGLWTAAAKAEGLSAEKSFEVEEVMDVEVYIESQTLFVKNTGNAIYTKPINIDVNEGQYYMTKKTSIAPKKTLEIKLPAKLPTGAYAIKIRYGEKEKEFQNVDIQSKDAKSFNIIYLILVFLLFGILLYSFVQKTKINTHPRFPRDFRKRDLTKLQRIKEKKKEEGPRHLFGKEEGLEDFRKRMVEQVRKTEEKILAKESEESIVEKKIEEPADSKKGDGLFNMFN